MQLEASAKTSKSLLIWVSWIWIWEKQLRAWDWSCFCVLNTLRSFLLRRWQTSWKPQPNTRTCPVSAADTRHPLTHLQPHIQSSTLSHSQIFPLAHVGGYEKGSAGVERPHLLSVVPQICSPSGLNQTWRTKLPLTQTCGPWPGSSWRRAARPRVRPVS